MAETEMVGGVAVGDAPEVPDARRGKGRVVAKSGRGLRDANVGRAGGGAGGGAEGGRKSKKRKQRSALSNIANNGHGRRSGVVKKKTEVASSGAATDDGGVTTRAAAKRRRGQPSSSSSSSSAAAVTCEEVNGVYVLDDDSCESGVDGQQPESAGSEDDEEEEEGKEKEKSVKCLDERSSCKVPAVTRTSSMVDGALALGDIEMAVIGTERGGNEASLMCSEDIGSGSGSDGGTTGAGADDAKMSPSEAARDAALGVGQDRRASEGGVAPTDIDKLHENDPRYCFAYAEDYYKYMHDLEERYRAPKPGFLDRDENEVTSTMRAILIDWLVEVTEEYKLHPPTLYISINYIDRVLKHLNVPRKKLQLVGCACMLIASKYEEIYAPSVEDFVYISDSTYRSEEVLEMERTCLTILDFKLTVSTLMTFLPRYIRAVSEDVAASASYTAAQKYMAMYLADLSLVEYETRQYRPSQVAAACLDLSRRTLRVDDHWCESLVNYSGYTAKELLPCVRVIAGFHRKAKNHNLKAVYEKYKEDKFMSVALLYEPLKAQDLVDDVVGHGHRAPMRQIN